MQLKFGDLLLEQTLILQKRVMRLMTFNYVFPAIPGPLRSADPIFIKLKYMKVEDIYNYQVAKFVYKCLNRNTPEQFRNRYKLNHQIHGHHTRSNFSVSEGVVINNLFVPNYGLKQLKVSGPRIWNELPSYLRNTSSLNIFLKNLKAYYISGMHKFKPIYMFLFVFSFSHPLS